VSVAMLIINADDFGRSAEILVVPGIEYIDAANRVHVLVWGEVPFLGERLSTNKMLEGVKIANGVAVLAHSSRRNASDVLRAALGRAALGDRNLEREV